MKLINCVECLDSEELAHEHRDSLCPDRSRAVELGRSAIRAVRNGYYRLPDGTRIDWSDAVADCKASVLSLPEAAKLPAPRSGQPCQVTRVQVANQTTLVAARLLHLAGQRPLALNFANGIQPGGGFLLGARAQEEGLCRSSALYATLEGDAMYEAHRQRPIPDFSSWAILSPRVPIFRTDAGVPTPWWPLDILTCAAPYAPRVGEQRSAQLLQLRIERVLEIAAAFGYRSLVLGAWGCGAFGNDPFRTAHDFREALQGRFGGVFEEVVFAITDWSENRRSLGPFRDTFSEIEEAG
jgi:uncharacterized protein (TIGR02452 family)